MKGKTTVAQRVVQFSDSVRIRLEPAFDAADVRYPPTHMTFVGLKDERRLEVWAPRNSGSMALVKTYPILASSGTLGPKLQEGDKQVPEGLYQVESLNPNSMFHLSIKLNYPNPFDLHHATFEGRKFPGSDIFIHGKAASIGCLAMGDEAIEELFILSAETGIDNIAVILAPVDFRHRAMPKTKRILPPWTDDLYNRIRAELSKL